MSFGVTATGFVLKGFADILNEVQQDQWDNIDPELDMQADGPLGQLNGIVTERLAQCWEVLQAVYRAGDPDQATEDALRMLCAITGIGQLAATASTVGLLLTGDDTTLVGAGSRVSGASGAFETDNDATLALAAPWAASGAYTQGDIVSNDGNIYFCTIGGAAAAAGGPTGDGTAIVDGTVTWRFVGEGLAYADASATATETGPIAANSWTLTEIETPVSGWTDSNNPLDALQGRNIETDEQLRVRREELLRASGNAALDAIRAKLLEVEDVTAVRVFENTTDTTDSDGIPPHAIEALVLGGDVDDIAQAIWDSKAAGIQAHGAITGNATDSLGNTRAMGFTRPTEVDIYVDVTVTTNTDYPTDGDDRVAAAIVALGNTLTLGDNVIRSSLFCPVLSVPGVTDITALTLGTAPAPAGTANIVIGDRQVSAWDTADVGVTS